MLDFSPKSSRIWQSAAFSLVYSSIFGVILRNGLIVGLLFLSAVMLGEGNSRLVYFSSALLSLALVWEAFYHFKLLKTRPSAADVSAKTNLADLVAFDLARRMSAWPFWETTASLLKILAADPKVIFTVSRSGIDPTELSQAGSEKQAVALILQDARAFAEKEGLTEIDSLAFFQALVTKSDFLQKLYFEKELKSSDLANIVAWTRNRFPQTPLPFWNRSVGNVGLGMANLWSGGWTLETEKYTFDLTLTNRGRDRYLVGREKEIEQLQEILLREEKRNAILLGEPGVGKETIVYSLARRSVSGQLPEGLRYKRFLELDLTAFSGGGNVEERLKNILTEISHSQDVVLFLPQIENIAGGLENGKFDISGLLTDYLERSLQIIGTTNRANYHKYIESKTAFSADFEIVDVPEPNSNEAIRILEQAALKMEAKNKVGVTYSAIKQAVELSERYMIDKVLPGKAIELLEEATVAAALKKARLVTTNEVEAVITNKTHVPATLASGGEATKLTQLEKILHQRIVGQDEAVNSVSQAVRRARTLKKDSRRPIGVFLFLGPTGVGKTETAKALAQVYFGSQDRIVRLDMSEFNQESSVYRLIGAPPGSSEYQEGGQLTEAVRANPFSLILLDELEKAHPKVQEIFLAIFDEGVTTDSSGRKISFSNNIIIGTSNAGAEFIREEILKKSSEETLKQNLLEKLLQEGTFKPEFLNRFDDVIVYRPLSRTEVNEVVGLLITQLSARLDKQDLALEVSPQVIDYLAQKGYDPSFGARPLQRVIQTELENRISQALLSGKLARGAKAVFSLNNNQIQLN